MNPREELVEIILAGLSCVNSSSIHPDGNRCRSKNYGCIWYADRIADALIPFIERGKAEAWDEGYRLDWTGGMSWTNPYNPPTEKEVQP